MSSIRPGRSLSGWARNPRLPLHTVRSRLTVLYGALFLLSGTALLAITYALAWKATDLQVGQNPLARIVATPAKQAQLLQQHANEIHQRSVDLHHLLASSGIALAITAALSIALGWVMAGRVLRPLRTMTTTAQRISEQNLHQRLHVAGPDDELKRLGDTIDSLLARLEAAFDAQRRFVANASHELRTPLTMMRTALDVATRKPAPPAQVAALAGKIRLGLDKADRLVAGFLTLARAQHDGDIQRRSVHLDTLAGAVLAERGGAIAGMHLTIEQDCRETSVCGSETLLTHMLDNLIDNAIRHNAPGGWIRISIDVVAGAAQLVIENSGPTLDPQTLDDLTQPFRRAVPDRTSASDTGVGLGLSIVAAIATTHRGNLNLHARPDGGLRATVTLPLEHPFAHPARPALSPAAPVMRIPV